jgi:hypothetical protein
MREAGTDLYGRRLRGLIIVLWRGGLRNLRGARLDGIRLGGDPRVGARPAGKGGRRREVGMDEWAWDQLRPWLEARVSFPVGPLFCVINGPTCGRPWSGSQVRIALRRTAVHAGVGGALLRTNCDTPTLSRWPGRASLSTSSSASWDMQTSGSPRSTCRGSIAAKSSRPSAHAALR